MKKYVALVLALSLPGTFYANSSLKTRSYHATKSLVSGTVAGLGALGIITLANMAYEYVTDSSLDFTMELLGREVNGKPLAITCCINALSAATYGMCRLASHAEKSAKKALSSSNLVEITRDTYESLIIESDLPAILVVVPPDKNLRTYAETALSAVQKDLGTYYTFGTLDTTEAEEILGITQPAVIIVRNGNLEVTHQGMYTAEQLRNLINK